MQTNLAQFYTSVLVILHETYMKKISIKKYIKKSPMHNNESTPVSPVLSIQITNDTALLRNSSEVLAANSPCFVLLSLVIT